MVSVSPVRGNSPCLRTMLGSSHLAPTLLNDPSRVTTAGASTESPAHLLLHCEFTELVQLRCSLLGHLLRPGTDPPILIFDRDLLQKAVLSNDNALYHFFENALSVLPRREQAPSPSSQMEIRIN